MQNLRQNTITLATMFFWELNIAISWMILKVPTSFLCIRSKGKKFKDVLVTTKNFEDVLVKRKNFKDVLVTTKNSRTC